MHQLFIVNGDPGARNSVDRIFIGEEPLQQLWRSGEFSSRMRFFFLNNFFRAVHEYLFKGCLACMAFSFNFPLHEYCTAPRPP